MTKVTRTKLARLEAAALGPRLETTTDPLERARIKDKLNISLELWDYSELIAMREYMAPGATVDLTERAEALAQLLGGRRLDELSAHELLELVYKISPPSERQRDPARYDERLRMARQLAEAEQLQQ